MIGHGEEASSKRLLIHIHAANFPLHATFIYLIPSLVKYKYCASIGSGMFPLLGGKMEYTDYRDAPYNSPSAPLETWEGESLVSLGLVVAFLLGGLVFICWIIVEIVQAATG